MAESSVSDTPDTADIPPAVEWDPSSETTKESYARLKREGRHEEFKAAQRACRGLWSRAQAEEHGGPYKQWLDASRHVENRRPIFLMAIAQFPPLAEGEVVLGPDGRADEEAASERKLASLIARTDLTKIDLPATMLWVLSHLDVKKLEPKQAPNALAWSLWQYGKDAKATIIGMGLKELAKVGVGDEDDQALGKQTRKVLTLVDEILAEIRCPHCKEILG